MLSLHQSVQLILIMEMSLHWLPCSLLENETGLNKSRRFQLFCLGQCDEAVCEMEIPSKPVLGILNVKSNPKHKCEGPTQTQSLYSDWYRE